MTKTLALILFIGATPVIGAQTPPPTTTTTTSSLSAQTGGQTQTIAFDDAIRIAEREQDVQFRPTRLVVCFLPQKD